MLPAPVVPDLGDQAFKCEQCQYTNNTLKGLNQHVRMKHSISQLDGNTEPDFEAKEDSIPVTINRVTKTIKISVRESLKEKVGEILESYWEDSRINGFDVKQEYDCFSVNIECWEFTEDFTVSSAAVLLESLPWPEGFSVIPANKWKPRKVTLAL